MACFVVGGAEAVVVSAVRHVVKKRELEQGVIDAEGNQLTEVSEKGFCLTRKLGWLASMLWGGVALLCIEHIWHGEVVLHAPFLTAMTNAADTAEMLYEMSTVGVGMCALVTCVWAAGCLVADAVAKRAGNAAVSEA